MGLVERAGSLMKGESPSAQGVAAVCGFRGCGRYAAQG